MDQARRDVVDDMIVKMRAGRMTRRSFLERAAVIGLGTTFAGTLLEACGSGSSSGGPTVVSWTSENDPTGTYKGLVDKFNSQNKKIQVHYTNGSAQSDQLLTQFSTMLRARASDVDIMSMDIIWPAEFGGNGWTIPLENKWPASDRKNFLQGPIQGCTYNGHIWAAPFRTDLGLIYYRTDLVSNPPSTWTDMVNISKNLTSSGKVQYGYVWQGNQYEGLVCDFVEVVYGYGGRVTDLSNPKNIQVTSTETINALQEMVSWVGSISPAAVTTYTEDLSRLTWQNGSSAFMRNWPYAIALGNASGSKIAGKFDIHPMLYAQSQSVGHSAIGGWNLGINAFAKGNVQDAAWQFVSYMLSEPAQQEAAIKASLTVARSTIYDNSAVLKAQPLFAKLKGPLSTALPRPVTAKYPDVTLAIQQEVHSALLKKASPSQAMNNLKGKLQTILG